MHRSRIRTIRNEDEYRMEFLEALQDFQKKYGHYPEEVVFPEALRDKVCKEFHTNGNTIAIAFVRPGTVGVSEEYNTIEEIQRVDTETIELKIFFVKTIPSAKEFEFGPVEIKR